MAMTTDDYVRGLDDGAAMEHRNAFVLVRELRAENARLRLREANLRILIDAAREAVTAREHPLTGSVDSAVWRMKWALLWHDQVEDGTLHGMTPEEQRVVFAVMDWIRIAREAGFVDPCHPTNWPTRADADHSGLLDRLLHGGTVHATAEEYRAATFTAEERAWVVDSVVASQALAGVSVTPGRAAELLREAEGRPLPRIGEE